MHGQDHEVLRDYVDPTHPRNICSLGAGMGPGSILNPHHIVFNYESATIIADVPSGVTHEIGVSGQVVAVAPNLSDVLWWSSGRPQELHDSWDGNDKRLQLYEDFHERCSNGDIDSSPGAFTRDSRYAYVLWNAFPEHTYINIVGNHTNVYNQPPPSTGGVWPQGQQPSMAVWSPVAPALYISQLGNVIIWSGGMPGMLKQGLTWIDPAISGDGKRIAYAQRESSGRSIVRLMDNSGNDLGQVGFGARTRPFFLTNDLIWLKSDQQGCAAGGPNTYVYDIRDQTETQSALDWVYATWPATSALGG
jgi:hypothetical protein